MKKFFLNILNNARTRMVLFLAIFAVLLFVVIKLVIWMISQEEISKSSASLKKAPNVNAVPWSSDTTQEYIKLQEHQNMQKAKDAKATGGSAIPTIVRIESLGDGEDVFVSNNVGFSKLSAGQEVSLSQIMLNQLTANGCALEDLTSAIEQNIRLSDLKQVCGCSKLKQVGLKLSSLKNVCNCKELKQSGFKAKILKANGYNATKLRKCGYSACDLKNAGFTLEELIKAGFTDLELKGAGFALEEIQKIRSGLPKDPILDEIKKASCTITSLNKLRKQGISAGKIKATNGCSADALKKAGFSASELKDAGFSAKQLKASGFSAKELYDAGFNAKELLSAGYSANKLQEIGINQEVINEAIASLKHCAPKLIQDKLKTMSLTSIKNKYGCSIKNFLQAGVNPQDLIDANFDPMELKRAGINADILKNGSCSIKFLQKAKELGASVKEIKQRLGCNADNLQKAGFSAKQLKEGGYTAKQLKNAGFAASELKEAGFSADQLKNAGFTASDLKAAGFNAKELNNAGFTAADLLEAGFSVNDLKKGGFSASSLKDAGVSAKQLKEAGFAAKELLNAGFATKDLKNAGFSAKELLDADVSVDELKQAGYTAKQLLEAGASLAELKQAGFTTKELKSAGVSAKDLKDLGFSAQELLKAGYSQSDLKNAGFNPNQIARAIAQNRANEQLDYLNDSGIRDALADSQTKRLKLRSSAELKALVSKMSSYANNVSKSWQYSEQKHVTNEAESNAGGNLSVPLPGAGLPGGNNFQAGPGGGVDAGPAFIKAGAIEVAILDTAINSDEPGPILATITQGKLKGAKLIGQIEIPPRGSKAILRFNTLSMPSQGNSLTINAVAIDINTARTAIASKTKYHTLERYGSLFASSFLEGFGKSFARPATTITTEGGVITSEAAEASAGESAISALAEVGVKWGDAIAEKINRPPTIIVFQGVALGILFTQDLTLPG